MTTVPDNHFAGCAKVSGSISFDDKVTKIGHSAFWKYFALTGPLILPVSLSSIGDSAFHGCSGLTGTLDIPAGVVTIPEYAFAACHGLTGLRSRTRGELTIKSKAFFNCYGLRFITIPSSAAIVASDAFEGCIKLVRVTLPRRLTSERDYAQLCEHKMRASHEEKRQVSDRRDKRGRILSYCDVMVTVPVCQDHVDIIFSKKCGPYYSLSLMACTPYRTVPSHAVTVCLAQCTLSSRPHSWFGQSVTCMTATTGN